MKSKGFTDAKLGFDIEGEGEKLQDGGVDLLSAAISLQEKGEALKAEGRKMYKEGQDNSLAGEKVLTEAFGEQNKAHGIKWMQLT